MHLVISLITTLQRLIGRKSCGDEGVFFFGMRMMCVWFKAFGDIPWLRMSRIVGTRSCLMVCQKVVKKRTGIPSSPEL